MDSSESSKEVRDAFPYGGIPDQNLGKTKPGMPDIPGYVYQKRGTYEMMACFEFFERGAEKIDEAEKAIGKSTSEIDERLDRFLDEFASHLDPQNPAKALGRALTVLQKAHEKYAIQHREAQAQTAAGVAEFRREAAAELEANRKLAVDEIIYRGNAEVGRIQAEKNSLAAMIANLQRVTDEFQKERSEALAAQATAEASKKEAETAKREANGARKKLQDAQQQGFFSRLFGGTK